MTAHSSLAGTALHESLRTKQPVRAASTANVSLSAPGATIDGVTLVSGDRILLKDQATASQNGIYLWTGAAAALTRTTDLTVAADFVFGFLVYVREGTTNGAKTWQYTQSAAVTVGTTSITFAQLGSAGLTDPTTTRGDLIARGASALARLALGASGTFVGSNGTDPAWGTSASHFDPTGLTGATAASRYAGATAAGAPASGTFAIGDYIIDQTGKIWICTTAGTPGTWSQVSGGGGGSSGGVSVGAAITAALAADVTITTAGTYYDGPSVTVGAGTWLLHGEVTLLDTSTAARFTAKLWDGTTGSGHELSSGELASSGANIPVTIPVAWVVSPTTSTTYKISATSNQSTNGKIKADAPDNGTTPHTASVLLAVPVPPVALPYIHIEDQKTSGTAGGTFTSGAWQTRTLNTVVSDTSGLASLATNQVTLPAGTYRFRASAVVNVVNFHQLRLQNVTDTTTLATGTNGFTSSTELAEVSGRFTLTGAKAIELQHRCSSTRATDGFGAACSFGTEVYAVVEFWKEG